MYAFIRGKIAEAKPGMAIVDVNGVGYQLLVPLSAHLAVGDEALFRTSFVVREQSQTLYGFLSIEDRDFFETLIGISGIGPKTALAIIGSLPTDLLHQAIADKDARLLAKVPGVGKKTAERLLVELTGKLPSPRSSNERDAIQALINLGYTQGKAHKAVQISLEELGKTADLSALITTALNT